MNPEDYSDLLTSVFLASVVAVLSVETLLEARLTSRGLEGAESSQRALRRWASVGVALCYFVALFLDFERGEGVLFLIVPLLFGPLLVSWFYVVRRFMRALAHRPLPTVAYSFASGAILVTSVHFDTPPFVLVLPAFLLAATISAVVTAFRAFTARRRLGRSAPEENDGAP